MICLNTSYTSTDTDDNDTSFFECSSGCENCTYTCNKIYVSNGVTYERSSNISYNSFKLPDPQEEDPPKDPPDPELIKFRRKCIYQRQHYKPIYHSKPLLKRKLLIPISGWLTRKQYRKKKGHNKR